MLCKKDVILWFKELESYRRIDTMCTLLNMCLPFELRFLGTCLEELGRRDSQELRGIELRVNNPQDLASDMVACQKGEPTDKKIRRKMALYLALIRACNRTCVAEIFRTLDGWGERDFLGMNDSDTLQELLLVYTMAANHPVFSFDQHMKCTDIFEKIKENKLICDQQQIQQLQQPMVQHLLEQTYVTATGQHQQQDLRQHMPPPSHQELLQQHALHAMHLSGQHHQLLTAAGPIQVLPQGSIPMNFPQAHLAKLIPSDGTMQHQITVDGIPHMLSSNISIPADTSNILPQWTLRSYPPPPGPSMEHPPQSSSPMLSQQSQQSSPSSSRTASPNRTQSSNIMQQQGMQSQTQQVRTMPQRMGGVSLKNVRRPSVETTPPPMNQLQQHQQIVSNEILLPQNMKHMDDVVMNNESSGNQLQNLIRNGFTRTGHHPRLKAGTYIPPHQQPTAVTQHYQAIPTGNYTGLSYAMKNMYIADGSGIPMDGVGVVGMNSNKSGGSDSGGSPIGSTGEISPPETPTLMSNSTTTNAGGGLRINTSEQQQQQQQQQQQKHHHQQQQQQQLNYNKQMNLTRLNGRSEKMMPSSAGGGGGGSIIYATNATHQSLTQQQQQQSQQIYGGDIILAPGGNAGNLMQNSLLSNNNNSGGNMIVSANNSAIPATSNNNMVAPNTVLISSSSAGQGVGGGGLIGNVITSNSVILQSPHQPQYNTSYSSYHAAAAAAAQHLASTSRPPPLMSHNQGMAPPPPGTFQLPGGFRLPPNGELMYPAYPPAGIAFLSAGGGAPQVALRSANSTALVSTNAVGGVISQSQQLQQQQVQSAAPQTSGLLTGSSPYSSALSVVGAINKPLSCYNCGSQTHSGRDCQEASMDDVTRSANYKLDYSVTAASSNTSPTATSSSAGLGVAETLQQSSSSSSSSSSTLHHQKTHNTMVESGSASATTTSNSVSTLLPPTAGGGSGVINTK